MKRPDLPPCGLSATGRWGRALLCEPVAGPPVLVEADGGKFVVPTRRGLNAERPVNGQVACGCRKPMPPGQMPGGARVGFIPCPAAGRLGKGWDDLRLVGLKLIFLIVSRAVSLLGLSRRESWWKDAEILMLRHQLTVAECERPRARARLTWPDRAWLA